MDAPRCPCCGEPMQSGYVRAPTGIQWRDESQKPLRWRFIWNALPHTLDWWTFRENRAWRCDQCQTLTIDHSRSLPAKDRRTGNA